MTVKRDDRQPATPKPDGKRNAKREAPVRDCREAPAPNPIDGTPAVDARMPVHPPPA
jgi:hypothetical protein